MNAIRVSILIPAFNAAESINRALQSALSQTCRDIEVIVVDDCSRDETVAVVQSAMMTDNRVRLLHTERNSGPGLARNLGLEAAQGEWVTFLDADDHYHSSRLARLLTVAQDYHADMTSDNIMLKFSQTSSASTPMFPDLRQAWPFHLKSEDFLIGCIGQRGKPRCSYGFMQPMIKRSFIVENNIKYDNIRFSEDFIFELKCLLRGAKWVVTPEALYNYEVHDTSLTANVCEQDLLQLSEIEENLFADQAVVSDPAVSRALRRHVKSVRQAVEWTRFAKAVKARSPWKATAVALKDVATASHILAQTTQTLIEKFIAVAARTASASPLASAHRRLLRDEPSYQLQ